ncbi:MAG TPA: 30S ribosomal protein S4 [Nanoarchaeota archaeon]|nr:30S ribosomal protein S4 [Nanoarchaeota archaeon]
MRRHRRKYERPRKRWDKQRIEYEKKLMEKYGLRRKKEIWRAQYILRKFRRRARDLLASPDEKAKQELLNKLYRLGLVEKDATLEDVLKLTVEDILERRLQTIVYRKGLAKTIKQARQFIVHGHIAVNGKRFPFPSALVRREWENSIGYYFKSPFAKQPPVQVNVNPQPNPGEGEVKNE